MKRCPETSVPHGSQVLDLAGLKPASSSAHKQMIVGHFDMHLTSSRNSSHRGHSSPHILHKLLDALLSPSGILHDGSYLARHLILLEPRTMTEKNWWEKVIPFVEICGLQLLAIYTAYTIKMHRANKLAADAAGDRRFGGEKQCRPAKDDYGRNGKQVSHQISQDTRRNRTPSFQPP